MNAVGGGAGGSWPGVAELARRREQPVVDKVHRLQSSYSISINCVLESFNPAVINAIFGNPLAWLSVQARRINPHWYLEGDDA